MYTVVEQLQYAPWHVFDSYERVSCQAVKKCLCFACFSRYAARNFIFSEPRHAEQDERRLHL